MTRLLRTLLVVDDDEGWLKTVTMVARSWQIPAIYGAPTIHEALNILGTERVDAMLVDVHLDLKNPGAQTGVDLARVASKMTPAPVIIAMSGDANPHETFALARTGVRHFVQKPCTPDELRRSLEAALLTPPDPEPFLRGLVGHEPLKDTIRNARAVMTHQAVAMAGGSRSKAARLLSITRQGVQQILQREDGPEASAQDLE